MRRFIVIVVLALFATMATAQEATAYMPVEVMPNGANFLPAPPDSNDSRFAYDIAQYQWGKTIRGEERGALACRHASYWIDSLLVFFSPVFGTTLSHTATPATYHLLLRSLITCYQPTELLKTKYQRTRPYVLYNESTSVPKDEEEFRKSGSYPSGHATDAWAMALLLAELNPANQDAILSLGYQCGQSRIITGFHWQSDVDDARLLVTAAYGRIHSSELFMEDLQKAKEELKPLLKAGENE